VLKQPDNLTVVPSTQELLLCEDADFPQYVRGLTTDGAVYDLARAITRDSEFAGACFDPRGRVLYVNRRAAGRRPTR
jgi:uncharacterized protein